MFREKLQWHSTYIYFCVPDSVMTEKVPFAKFAIYEDETLTNIIDYDSPNSLAEVTYEFNPFKIKGGLTACKLKR